jgi:hypothetical protein
MKGIRARKRSDDAAIISMRRLRAIEARAIKEI